MDDPYIIQHSIHGLFLGYEDRFIGGQPLDGITSPAFLLPIVLLSTILPSIWAHALINAAAAVLYIAGVFRFAISAGLPTIWAALIAALGTLAGLTLWQLFNGLETGLAMAAVIWTLRWFRDPLPDKPWKFALLGILPFIRPELAALSLVVTVRVCWSAIKTRPSAAWIVSCIAYAAAGVVPVVAFLLLNNVPLMPNTASAKAYFFAEGCRPLLHRFVLTITMSGGFFATIGLAVLGIVGLPLSRWGWRAAAFIAILFATYIVTLPSAPGHNFHRYLYVLIPFIMVGWVAMVSSFMTRVRRLSMVGLVAAVGLAAVHLEQVWRLYNEQLDLYSRVEMPDLSDWIVANIPSSETIAIHDAGYISLHGAHPLVDIVGLKTPASIEAHKRHTYQSCSRDARALDQIARQHDARYFVVLDHWDEVFRLTGSLRLIGWTVTRIDTERGDTPYKVYRLTSPDVHAPD